MYKNECNNLDGNTVDSNKYDLEVLFAIENEECTIPTKRDEDAADERVRRIKICSDYRKTINGVITTIYNGQKGSSKKRGHEQPKYTKEELRIWLTDQRLFGELYENWVKSNYNRYEKPSVDRIDNSKGYSLNNIFLNTWRENNKNGNKDMKNTQGKDKKYYENKTTRRSDFKKICNVQGWNFEEFEEVFGRTVKDAENSNRKEFYYKERVVKKFLQEGRLSKNRRSDAGYDVYSVESIIIKAGESELIKTGLKVNIPCGMVAVLKSRSGLSVKHKLEVGAGVIDHGYEGEVGVHLYNFGKIDYLVEPKDRIAQMLVSRVELDLLEDEFDDIHRGEAGFGASGK